MHGGRGGLQGGDRALELIALALVCVVAACVLYGDTRELGDETAAKLKAVVETYAKSLT